jgi:hypothetical protein
MDHFSPGGLAQPIERYTLQQVIDSITKEFASLHLDSLVAYKDKYGDDSDYYLEAPKRLETDVEYNTRIDYETRREQWELDQALAANHSEGERERKLYLELHKKYGYLGTEDL